METGTKVSKDRFLPLSILLAAILIVGATVYKTGAENKSIAGEKTAFTADSLAAALSAPNDIVLPAKWGDLGKQLVDKGVIDPKKFEAIYAQSGGLSPDEKTLLHGTDNGNLVISAKNSGVILNLLWAFGLANKNDILEKGPMTDPRYGGAGNPPAGGFASTGGWTIAKGQDMDYYSKFPLVVLTADEEAIVTRVARNIYRPCCDNSTYFPDCNHGMAMLGFLELMASQGVGEADMYRAALAVNAFWFEQTYLTLEKYFSAQGTNWNAIDPKEILGANFSSYTGFSNILKQITPASGPAGGGCSVQ